MKSCIGYEVLVSYSVNGNTSYAVGGMEIPPPIRMAECRRAISHIDRLPVRSIVMMTIDNQLASFQYAPRKRA